MRRNGQKLRFNVGVTFSETTPESAEHGDTSDNGWINEPQRMTLKETIDTIKEHYVYENFQDSGSSQSLYGEYYTQDYYTGTGRQEAVHIDADRRFKNHKRSMYWLNKCIQSILNKE